MSKEEEIERRRQEILQNMKQALLRPSPPFRVGWRAFPMTVDAPGNPEPKEASPSEPED